VERFTDESQAPYLTTGLAQYGADYYAVLGVPLGATQDQIRQGYLKAAKLLHPDRYIGNEEGKEEASRLFSGLVTPAYDILNRQNRRQEYDMMMRLLATKLLSATTSPPTVAALSGCKTKESLNTTYAQALEELAKKQYKEIAQTVGVFNEISQLNLAYLLLNQKVGDEPSRQAPVPETTSAEPTPTPAAAIPIKNWSDRHFERGQDFLKRKQYREAIQSFKESLRLEPGNANVHTHLGIAFLRQGYPGMAKAEFQKSLTLDPKNEMALKYMRSGAATDPATGKGNSSKGANKATPAAPDKNILNKLWNQLNKPL
jgi:curved DNA-binding protein CbpA